MEQVGKISLKKRQSDSISWWAGENVSKKLTKLSAIDFARRAKRMPDDATSAGEAEISGTPTIAVLRFKIGTR